MNANLKQCDLAGLAQPIKPVTCRRLQSLQAKVCLHAVAIICVTDSGFSVVASGTLWSRAGNLLSICFSYTLTDYTDVEDWQLLLISPISWLLRGVSDAFTTSCALLFVQCGIDRQDSVRGTDCVVIAECLPRTLTECICISSGNSESVCFCTCWVWRQAYGAVQREYQCWYLAWFTLHSGNSNCWSILTGLAWANESSFVANKQVVAYRNLLYGVHFAMQYTLQCK